MPFSLESLPEAWLRQFAQTLPTHLKLKLRCCSRRLQGYVDELGVGITASRTHVPTLALQLTAAHLTSLNTAQLLELQQQPTGSTSTHDQQQEAAAAGPHDTLMASDNSSQAALANCIQLAAGGLPMLEKLTVNVLQQPDLFAAVVRSSPSRLKHVRLVTRQQVTGWNPQQLARHGSVLQELPVCVPTLQCLDIDYYTYSSIPDIVHASLSQHMPQLNSLVLQPKPAAAQAVSCGRIIQLATWTAVFQPLLVTLTRLDLGSWGLGVDSHSVSAEPPDAPGAVGAASATGTPASSTADTAAAPVPASEGLGHLLQLSCRGLDGPLDANWCLCWLSSCSNLTALHIRLCSAGELDCDVLAQLQQLQSLSLRYFEDELVTSPQLAPLSACCRLTQLKLGALLVEHPAAAVDGGSPGTAAAAGAAASSDPAAALGAAGAASSSSLVLLQLTSLQRLTANLLCRAPLTILAPSLTRLNDADYDLAALDLPGTFVSEHPPAEQAALAGLTGLQVLSANIFALVRHAAHPAHLTSLCELHIDMVGSLEGSCVDPGGLPYLPHLTKLVMTIDRKVHKDLRKTYTTTEDALLWCNQSAVRHVRLRGSALLGGFLVEQALLQQLPTAMPQLQLVEVVKADDLQVQQLRQLVQTEVCRRVHVQGCDLISERECVELEQVVVGRVTVEFSL